VERNNASGITCDEIHIGIDRCAHISGLERNAPASGLDLRAGQRFAARDGIVFCDFQIEQLAVALTQPGKA
jgi:hypothetical protein